MLPQIDGPSVSPIKVYSILVFHLLVGLNRGESQVVGPHQPIVALVNNDIMLPCHVEPEKDVTAEILEWTRSDLTPRFVHVWRAGQDLVNTRNPLYKERTSLFINELKNGNISLKLSGVKLSDEGTYECHVPLMDKKAFVKLVVASDAATSPVISLSGIDKTREGVVLQCESAGWYPEPELLWLDGEGNLISAGPTETLRGPDDLYTVSSRVTVEKRHGNNITCRVQEKNINQSRETHIHVPEDFFEVQSSSSSVTIGLAVSLALCIILLILSAVILLCTKRRNMINTKRTPEDQTDRGDEEKGEEEELMKLQGEKLKSKEAEKKVQKGSVKFQEEKKKHQEAETQIKELQTKINEMEKELQQEKQRKVGTVEQLNQLQEEKKKREEAEKQIKELQTKINEKEKELEREKLRNEGSMARWNQLHEEKKKREEAEKQIKELQTKINEMEKELQQEKLRNIGTVHQQNQQQTGDAVNNPDNPDESVGLQPSAAPAEPTANGGCCESRDNPDK